MDLEEEAATGATGDAHLKPQARQRSGPQDQQHRLMTAADLMPLWASAQEASSSMAVAGGGGGGGTEDTDGEGRKRQMEFGGGRGEGDEYGDFEVVNEGEYDEEDEDDGRQTRALTANQRGKEGQRGGFSKKGKKRKGRPQIKVLTKKEKKQRQLEEKEKQRRRKEEERARRWQEEAQRRLEQRLEGQARMREVLRLVVAQPESREEEAGVAGGSALQAVIMDNERSHALRQAYEEVVQGMTETYMFQAGRLPYIRLEVVDTFKEHGIVLLQLRGQWVGMFTVQLGLNKYGQLVITAFYVRPEYHGLGIERAALHLINTVALAMRATGVQFSQAIDARTRPDLVKMWEDWGVTVAELPGGVRWRGKGQAEVRRMSITPEAASEMHARYTEEQLRLIDEHVEQQQWHEREDKEEELVEASL